MLHNLTEIICIVVWGRVNGRREISRYSQNACAAQCIDAISMSIRDE